MATGGGDFLAEMTDRLLVCEICQEDFGAQQRLPRVLPCHHAFCGQCLQQLSKDGRLACPKCRSVFSVEDSFPVETTRMTLLDLKKTMGLKGEPDCQGCSEGAKASHKCLDCQELLCEECCRSHRRVNATRNHSLLCLAEAAKDPIQLLQLKEKCQQHKDKTVEFYCRQCQVAGCSSCAILLHSGHEMADLEAVLEERRKEVRAVCRRLQEAIPRFQKRADNSSAGLQMLDARHSETAAKVRQVFSQGMQLLQARQDEVLAELGAKVKSDRLALETQEASDQSLLSEAQASLQFGERVASLGLASQLLPGPQDLARTCDSLESRGAVPAVPEPEYQVDTSNMAATEAAVRYMGDISTKTEEMTVEELPLSYPDFTFDIDVCNLTRSVSGGGRVLTNPPQAWRAQQDSERCQFQGTLVTRPLPAESCFWQLKCAVTPRPRIKEWGFCDVGVVEREAVFVLTGQWALPETDLSFSVLLETTMGQVTAKVYEGEMHLATETLCPFTPDRPVEVTLGFLLDAAKGQLYVIEVSKPRVLESRQVELSTPLFLAAAVSDKNISGGEVRVELLSGEKLSLSRDLIQLLKSLLEKGNK